MSKPLSLITRLEMFLDNGWFRWVIGPALLLVSGIWTLLAFRTFGVVAFLVAASLFIAFVRGGRLMPLVIAWPLCIASAFIPVDARPYRFGGEPRLVHVGYGCFDAIAYERQTLGNLVIGWPGVPGLRPKWILIWYAPPAQTELDDMSAWHLKMIWFYLRDYAEDHAERLPLMDTTHDVSMALSGYDHDLGPQIFVQPQTGTQYIPNPVLSKKKIDDIVHPERVIEYAEAQPAINGTHGVVFADGHADRLTPTEWQRLWLNAASRSSADGVVSKGAQSTVRGRPNSKNRTTLSSLPS